MNRQSGWAHVALARGPAARQARNFVILLTLALTALPVLAGTASAAEPGNAHFLGIWQRKDLPVSDLLVNRTWIWGPQGNTGLLVEPYAESPGGERTVQYFDKSRMEITQPDGDPNSIWYVTNGLLVVELITGNMQVGDNLFEQREPADLPVAGDLGDEEGPTYVTFAGLLDAVPAQIGDLYTNRLSRSGQVTSDPGLAAYGVEAGHFDEVTQHTIAAPFWAFMNSTGLVYQDGQFVENLLFQDPVFATGRPITEAYWANVLIGGMPADVLMQCFERRCLTYNPSNPEGWQVEAGNVGIHYHEWRYSEAQEPGPGDPNPGDPGDPPPGDPPPGDPPPDDPEPADPVELPAPVIESTFAAIFPPDNVATIEVEFSFDPGDGELPEGFRVYRSKDGGDFSVLFEFDFGPNFFEDQAIEYGVEYCYYLTAYAGESASEPSNIACDTAPAAPYDGPAPTAPANLNAEAAFDSTGYPKIHLTWEDRSDNEYAFRVYHFQPGNDPEIKALVGMDTTSIYFSYNVGEEWCFHVVSMIEHVESPPSNTACAIMPGVPNLLSPEDGYISTTRVLDYSWDPVPGATGYLLCISQPGDACEFAPGPHYTLWVSVGTSVNVDLLAFRVPDGALTEFVWTVAACWGDAYHCLVPQDRRALTFDLRPQLTAPALVSPSDNYDTADRQVEFSWQLVPNADSYVICVAEPGANCPNETGAFFKSSVLGPTVSTYPLDIPAWLAPDDQITELHWTVAACAAPDNCVWQTYYRRLMMHPGISAPSPQSPAANFVSTERRVEFEWTLGQGVSSYLICVAAPGDNCRTNPELTFQSSPLGPGVTSYPLDIPAWMAPDGVATQLNWLVVACDSDGDCLWLNQSRPLTIDLTPPPQVTYPAVVAWDVAAGWVRLEFNGPNGSIWEYHVGGATYRVNGDGTKTLLLDGGESLNYPLLIEGDGTTWMLLVSADRQTHRYRRYDDFGSILISRSDLPAAAEAAIPLEFREPGARQYGRVIDWNVAAGWVRLDYSGSIWEYHIGGQTYRVNADGSTTLILNAADSLNYTLLIQNDGTTWMLLVSSDRQSHSFRRFETGGSIQVGEADLPAAAAANIPTEFQ